MMLLASSVSDAPNFGNTHDIHSGNIYAARVVNYAPRVVNYASTVVNYAPRVINYAPRERL
jgi:hypothetical protein